MNTIVRIQAYKDFYANYDAEKDFQRMKVLSRLPILQLLTVILFYYGVIISMSR